MDTKGLLIALALGIASVVVEQAVIKAIRFFQNLAAKVDRLEYQLSLLTAFDEDESPRIEVVVHGQGDSIRKEIRALRRKLFPDASPF